MGAILNTASAKVRLRVNHDMEESGTSGTRDVPSFSRSATLGRLPVLAFPCASALHELDHPRIEKYVLEAFPYPGLLYMLCEFPVYEG